MNFGRFFDTAKKPKAGLQPMVDTIMPDTAPDKKARAINSNPSSSVIFVYISREYVHALNHT